MIRTWLLLTVLSLSLLLPAWSQTPGLTDPVVPPQQQPSGTQAASSGGIGSWNLSELLWGITQLQDSPKPLTSGQKAQLRLTLTRVLEGARLVKTFESRARALLRTEQLEYIEHLAITGRLNKVPELPPVPGGQDPLVNHVLKILEERAGR
jgi:hypothetical protein